MQTTNTARRVRAALTRFAGLLALGVLLLGVAGVVLFPPTPTQAGVLADVPTQLPAPPTAVPPEPTNPPVPGPTDPPQQVPGATNPPDAPRPSATPKHDRDKDKDHKDKPTQTPSPEPSATPVPPSPTPVPQVEIRTRKTVNVDTANPGDTVVYTVVVDNIGAGTAVIVLCD